MRQTPAHDAYNPDLLELLPRDAHRVVEVGCSRGALARAYRALNPACDYIGIEVDRDNAELAGKWCSRVVVDDIEEMDDQAFGTLADATCWVFGDVLEHLYDPWAVLRRIRNSIGPEGSIIACIPNSQHWSFQARVNCGLLRYEDAGLLDRTHIRWFTRTTIRELFESAGLRIDSEHGRVFDEPSRARALVGVRALAQAIGTDADEAERNAIPLQWVVRAVIA